MHTQKRITGARTAAARLIGVAALAAILLAARPAEAGPPLVCQPFDAGKAALLPWGAGTGWNLPDPAYDVREVTADTLRLLSPDAPVLARMENMRRAAIYAGRDRAAAAALLEAVLDRARRATPGAPGRALALFDAGYLIETYRQASGTHRWDMLSVASVSTTKAKTSHKTGVDGYAMVREALALVGESPEMEFAASLMTEGAASAAHRHRAVAGVTQGSLLARNLGTK